jgi:hypothetical protein
MVRIVYLTLLGSQTSGFGTSDVRTPNRSMSSVPPRIQVADLALKNRVPAVRRAGRPRRYSGSQTEMARRTASIIDKILKGRKPAARSQRSRRLAAHRGSPGDRRQDALPYGPDCGSRRRPAVRARTRVDRHAHRPTIGRSWCGRDRARGSACRRQTAWLIQTHALRGGPAAAPATKRLTDSRISRTRTVAQVSPLPVLQRIRLSDTASSRSGQCPASLRSASTAVGAMSLGYRPVLTRVTRTSVWRPPRQ